MKESSDPIKLRQALTRFAYHHNINMVTEWHNKLYCGLNEGIKELEKQAEEANKKNEIKNIKSSIHFYENYISNNLRNFTLIMHLSNFEEISTLVCKEMITPTDNISSITRFKKGWEKKIGKKLGDVPSWTTLKDAEKIRHAILHSAGRISLNNNKDVILSIIKKENLEKENDRVYVTEEYLNKVKNSICEMVK